MTYTWTINEESGRLVTEWTPEDITFSFFYIDSLEPLGLEGGNIPEEKDYYITVTATDENNLYPTSGTYKLTVKNPCVDPNYAEILQEVVMPQYKQFCFTDLQSEGGLRINSESLLEIRTTVIPSDICMTGLMYRIVFDSNEIDENSPVARVITATREEVEAEFYSESTEYLGYNILSVEAILPYDRRQHRRLQNINPDDYEIPDNLPPNPFKGNPLGDQTVIDLV